MKNVLYTALILLGCFGMCLLLQEVIQGNALIPVVFVLGVFLTSVVTDGYVYGIAASVLSVLAVNFAFTFPYFRVNFTIPQNLFSAILMIIVALITSGLTTKLKHQDEIRAESEREKTRADLFRAVSHDLRTPLTTIYGSSSALLENENDFTHEQKVQMLQSIKQDSLWLFRMVENLLSITRLDSGNVKIIKTPTVLDELVDSVLVKFHKRYPEQKVEIELPEELVIIPMDAILIEQVLINILENAVQHAEGMEKLCFQVTLCEKNAVFTITDDGAGIPEEKLKTMFRGGAVSYEASSDCKRSNAGIGLSVCATIIRAHGGVIEAKNLKQGGACFRFQLEMEDEENDL